MNLTNILVAISLIGKRHKHTINTQACKRSIMNTIVSLILPLPADNRDNIAVTVPVHFNRIVLMVDRQSTAKDGKNF